MEGKFIVTGGNRLNGTVNISGAKNSILALMTAAALAKEDVLLNNIPLNSDVYTMGEILASLGVKVVFQGNTVIINGATINTYKPPYELVRKIRASVYAAGLLLARLGHTEVALPGGDEIG